LAYLGRSRSGIDSHPSPLYADEDLGRDLDNAVYALDASTIDLRLSVFPWALFRSTESAVKLQNLLDLQGNIPTFIHISDGKLHDVNVLDLLIPEPGAFYIMDRGHVDFERLFTLHRTGRFFVIRAKSNTKYRRRYSHPGDEFGGVRCDRTIALSRVKSGRDYPLPLRRKGRAFGRSAARERRRRRNAGHATRHQVIAGVLVPRGVRAGTDARRTRAAEGNWPSPHCLHPKLDGPHFGLREKWRRSGS